MRTHGSEITFGHSVVTDPSSEFYWKSFEFPLFQLLHLAHKSDRERADQLLAYAIDCYGETCVTDIAMRYQKMIKDLPSYKNRLRLLRSRFKKEFEDNALDFMQDESVASWGFS